MSKILRRMGHRVSQADDGVPALQMIREREEVAASSGKEGKGGFDVVFLDK
jgi:CheY-like chemotaxis protein